MKQSMLHVWAQSRPLELTYNITIRGRDIIKAQDPTGGANSFPTYRGRGGDGREGQLRKQGKIQF
jgi:hypothetical protein